MYIVLLRFSANKALAPEHMDGHQAWIRQGMEDGVFLLVGGMQPGPGGVVLAAGESPEDLRTRVAKDPFVIHDVVEAEIIEVAPSLTDPRLAFLEG